MSSMFGPNSLAMISVSFLSCAAAWPATNALPASEVRVAAFKSERRLSWWDVDFMEAPVTKGWGSNSGLGKRRHVGAPAAELRDVQRAQRRLGLAEKTLHAAAVGQLQRADAKRR